MANGAAGAGGPPLIAGIFLLSARLGTQADEAFHQASAHTSQRMVEFAQAQSVLRAFNGEGGGTRFLEQAIDRQYQSGKRLIYISTASVVLNSWVVQLVFATLLVTGATLLSHYQGNLPAIGSAVGTVIALMLVSRFIDPLLDVASYGEALRNARGQLNAVSEILAITPCPNLNRRNGHMTARWSCAMFRSAIRQNRLPYCAGSALRLNPAP